MTRWVSAILAVLVVLAAVVWVRLLLAGEERVGVPDGATPIVAGAVVTSEQAKRSALAAAADATTEVLSYRAATLDQDVAEARALVTGEMRDRYDRTMAAIAPGARRNQTAVEAAVVAVSIISVTDEDAKALLFVDQTTTGRHLDQPTTERNRVVVTLHRDAGRWRVTRLDAL